MCGIAGIVRFDRPAEAERDRARRLLGALRHRGPDGDGLTITSHAALVHTRLALLDPEGGAQPLTSLDGRFTLVYNGELHDPEGLKKELAGRWNFHSRCDAEVVLAAWATWGPSCLDRLDGMFAFFVWDEDEGRGWGLRDRLGVKPFVYRWTDEVLIFASEAKALVPLLPGRPRAALEPLLEYLVAPCFSGVERPMFEGLEQLEGGELLEVDRRGLRRRSWWDYQLDEAEECDAEALAAELRHALARATRRTLRADADVGLFLSGGLDSTLLGALAREAGQRPPAFTVRFEGQDTYDYTRSRIVTSDDTPFAEQAARDLDLNQTWAVVDRDDLAGIVRRLAVQNCALPAWEQEIAQDQLARVASQRCKAVLVGDVADETHWGYHFLLDPEATASPSAIMRRFARAPVRPDLIGDPELYFERRYRTLVEEAGHDWGLPRSRLLATAYLIVRRWLPRLLHNGDVHTMAWGLEARVPFADLAVLDVARRVDPEVALAGGVEKALLRRAGEGLVASSIQWRKKSALPKDQGTLGIYRRELRKVFGESEAWLGSVLDIEILRRLIEGDGGCDEVERSLLFRVLALVHWSRHYGVLPP